MVEADAADGTGDVICALLPSGKFIPDGREGPRDGKEFARCTAPGFDTALRPGNGDDETGPYPEHGLGSDGHLWFVWACLLSVTSALVSGVLLVVNIPRISEVGVRVIFEEAEESETSPIEERVELVVGYEAIRGWSVSEAMAEQSCCRGAV